MATESKSHPEKDQLIAFGQGILPEDESSEVEQHLEVCPECCETLLDLKDDTFVGLIKVAKLTETVGPLDLSEVGSGEITAQDTTLKSGLSVHRTGHESEQAATLLGTITEDSVLDELPPELVNHPRYRIVGLLGRGGMGNVYRAEHRLMSRPVAIKLINSNLVRNRTAVERFRREVQAAAKLSHPNIVAAFDAEQAGDVHFLVMEFVEGTDLATVVKERGPMSVNEACRCIQQAAAGLQHAHEKGMVHRDIKPHNLMLAGGGQVRILDFGLAGFAESTVGAGEEQNVATELESSGLTVSPSQPPVPATAAHLTTMGSVMGTPDYMAPEQAVDAHSADIRADIYSLGCTLYFLLTGRPPFERDGVAAKLKAHASVSPPSLTEERSDVPLELSDIVARMMAKKPESRFQSPDDVVAALEPFVSPPLSAAKRNSFVRRAVIAAALLVPLLLLAVIITIATDKGHIEIDAQTFEDPQAEVILKREGQVTARFKLKPGRETQTIATGEYRVELVTSDKDVELDLFMQHRRANKTVLGIPMDAYLHTMQTNSHSPVMVYRGSGMLVRVSKRNSTKNVKATTDDDILQGRWVAKTIKAGNGAMPAGVVPQWTMTFSGQSVQVTSPTGGNEGTFKLDGSKDPKEIDIEPTDGKGLIRGIYRFVGDELEVCIEDSDRKRPIQWDVDVGTRQMLIRLQRQALNRTDSEQMSPKDASRSQNLITDPSFEDTGITQLPRGWRQWLNDGPGFRCEVVAGGHTGKRCLRISGKGTRGVVFGNDLRVDRSKRYALKGWVRFEGEKDSRALIKLNYFRGGEFLGVHDLVGATADQPGWHLFEKTDMLDAYPTADHFYAMCHVEGSGTGWFDDLELIAYDRDKLPNDFDLRHGRHNRLHGPNSLHRWIGTWDVEYSLRETENAPQETRLSMTTTSERTLGDYFLMSFSKAKPPASDERLQFLLFDQNLGAFRQWQFSSSGKVFEWRGPWNIEKQSLELRLLPDASNLNCVEHFVDEDHIEARHWFQYVMGQRDAGRWTATRNAFDGKVDVPIANAHATEPADLSQLNKFVGEWTIHAKFKPSVWNPQPLEETARETSVWILDGRFLMTRCFNQQDELTSIWIATYEPKEKSNRFWSFRADGSGGESRLTWDEASNGFQFRAVDLPDGWSGTGFNRWVDEDSFDNQAVIKDESGRVMLDMTQERRRKK